MAKKEYLVRGAMLICSKGKACKRLELPEDHGVYTKNQPMIHERDCVVDINIPKGSFGVCDGDCPAGAKVMKVPEFDEEGNVIGETEYTGPACEPVINEKWKKPNKKVLIDDNGTKRRALTTDSLLICKYGGIITVVTSGQELGDES